MDRKDTRKFKISESQKYLKSLFKDIEPNGRNEWSRLIYTKSSLFRVFLSRNKDIVIDRIKRLELPYTIESSYTGDECFTISVRYQDIFKNASIFRDYKINEIISETI